MIVITATDQHRYRVEYRLEGVLVYAGEFSEGDLSTAMSSVKEKMLMVMGLTKGKTFVTKTGREI